MPDVIFEEQRISQRQREAMRQTSSFANWLIKVGIAKTESQAILITIGFVIISIVVSLFLFFGGGKTNAPPQSITPNQENNIK